MPKEVYELRKELIADVPHARERLMKLIDSDSERVALGAVELAYAYGLGKPAYSADGIEEQLREKFAEAFEKAKQRLEPEIYKRLIEALR